MSENCRSGGAKLPQIAKLAIFAKFHIFSAKISFAHDFPLLRKCESAIICRGDRDYYFLFHGKKSTIIYYFLFFFRWSASSENYSRAYIYDWNHWWTKIKLFHDECKFEFLKKTWNLFFHEILKSWEFREIDFMKFRKKI